MATGSEEKDIRVDDDAVGMTWSLAWSWSDRLKLNQEKYRRTALAKAFGSYRAWIQDHQSSSSTPVDQLHKGLRPVLEWNYALVRDLFGPGDMMGACYIPLIHGFPSSVNNDTNQQQLKKMMLPGWVYALGRLSTLSSVRLYLQEIGPWYAGSLASEVAADPEISTSLLKSPFYVEQLWKEMIYSKQGR